MFIDERTRTAQKHILDALYELTGIDGVEFHAEEIQRYRGNPYSAEFSNFLYCSELKLKSWFYSVHQLSKEQKVSLWSDITARCSMVSLVAPDEWGITTSISTLVEYLITDASGMSL